MLQQKYTSIRLKKPILLRDISYLNDGEYHESENVCPSILKIQLRKKIETLIIRSESHPEMLLPLMSCDQYSIFIASGDL